MELISRSEDGKCTWENGVYIGDIHADVDGFYKFWPDVKGGYWDELILFALYEKLQEMNKEWREQIDRDMAV